MAHGAGNLAASVGFFVSGAALRRWGGLGVLTRGLIIDRVAGIAALAYPTSISPALLVVPSSLTYGPEVVATDVLSQQEFTDEQRATLGSMASLLGSLGFGVASIGVGWAADQLGAAAALLLVQVVMLTPLFFYWRIFRGESRLAA